MKELARRGHKVILFGKKGSDVKNYGIELQEFSGSFEEFERVIPSDTDIVHLSYASTLKRDIPLLVNIHGNGQIGENFPLNTVFVSKKHAENHGSDCYVHNALDLEEYPFFPKEWKLQDLLFLAKASWRVKNLKDSIWIAKRSEKTLHIAGGRAWFPSRFVRSYGVVGGEEKKKILEKTDALLFPVRWHEPFGIAIIEAMASGNPVFGSCYGSLPEIIGQDVGILAKSKEELLAYISEPRVFSRRKIRNYVETHFNIKSYTDKYLDLYARVINGEKLNPVRPTWKLKTPPQELLSF